MQLCGSSDPAPLEKPFTTPTLLSIKLGLMPTMLKATSRHLSALLELAMELCMLALWSRTECPAGSSGVI